MLKGMSFEFLYGFASVYDSWVKAKISDATRSCWEDRGCNGSVSWHVCSCRNCLCVCVVGVHLSMGGPEWDIGKEMGLLWRSHCRLLTAWDCVILMFSSDWCLYS